MLLTKLLHVFCGAHSGGGLHVLEELLGVGPDLSAEPCPKEAFDSLPVAAVLFQTYR